jgi:hypothetical protein
LASGRRGFKRRLSGLLLFGAGKSIVPRMSEAEHPALAAYDEDFCA